MRRLFLVFILLNLMPVLSAEELPISRAVRMAVDHSPYLKALEAGKMAANEKIGQAKAMSRAKVTLGVSDSHMDSPMSAFGAKLNQGRISQSDFLPSRLNDPDYTSNLQLGIQVVQPLYLGGMDRHAISASKEGVKVSLVEIEKAQEDIIFKAIEAYLNVVLARESVLVAEKAVEASTESVRNTGAAFEAMQAVQSDVFQAKVHHSQNQETLLRMKNRSSLALDGLARILGVHSAEDFRLSMPFLEQECEVCKDDPGKLLEIALKQRPEYLKFAFEKNAVWHMERVARGGVRPHFAIGAGSEHNRGDFSGSGNGNSMIFARVDWNVADGGEARHKAREARWQQEQLDKMATAIEDQIFLEIRQAVTNINNSLERIRVSAEAITQSEESLRILRDRYLAGLAIISELLGAETSVLSHRMNHLQALYDYSISKAKLKMSLGELTFERCELLREESEAK